MTVQIITGDCRKVLKSLDSGSIRCCVTSPPYWRQRDYGMAGQIGLEQTPEQYVAEMVEIFSEVRRVLTDDGTLWLNVGDKWSSSSKWGGATGGKHVSGLHGEGMKATRHRSLTGLKDKNLVGIPWMLAFALRADGWYLRQANIWAKPNCMPESVTDRSTSSHEYVLQLSKSNRYFYNADAARTPAAPTPETRLAQDIENQAGSSRADGGGKTNGTMKAVSRKSDKQRGHSRRHNGFNDRWDQMSVAEQRSMGANLRSVWWISTAQYRDGHYAVMPDALAEICITCGSERGDTVLDPFSGAGTTALVADRLGRHAIGIELNPAYADMARKRIENDAPLFAEVGTAFVDGGRLVE